MQTSNNIHFIGIGGIGISALAYLCIQEGKQVTGSDQGHSALIDDLVHEGVHIYQGHRAEHINSETELVIYTAAINRHTNPEYLQAKKMGIKMLSYFEALGQLSRCRKTIVVMGTHGKTTTTGMLGMSLIKAGMEPLVIVGSKIKAFNNRNLYFGQGDLMVAEACEYQESFLNLDPFGAIFLNCEAEHLDYYKNEENYKAAYQKMVRKIPAEGFLIANKEDKNVRELAQYCSGKVIWVDSDDINKLKLDLSVIGQFNQLNAVHAYKAAFELEEKDKLIRYGLKSYEGAWRRMEIKGQFQGATVIDDYGHHPTEIKETLKAIKEHYPQNKIICVFQPHQYSRTHLLINEFKEAFTNADEVLITDIYEARDSEEDKNLVSTEKLVQAIAPFHNRVKWSGNLEETGKIIKEIIDPKDIIVTMGAGNIGSLADILVG